MVASAYLRPCTVPRQAKLSPAANVHHTAQIIIQVAVYAVYAVLSCRAGMFTLLCVILCPLHVHICAAGRMLYMMGLITMSSSHLLNQPPFSVLSIGC
jgi:hypothetical protein